MKLKMLACCCSLLGVTAFAQKNEWKDPNVNEVNRAPCIPTTLRLKQRMRR